MKKKIIRTKAFFLGHSKGNGKVQTGGIESKKKQNEEKLEVHMKSLC